MKEIVNSLTFMLAGLAIGVAAVTFVKSDKDESFGVESKTEIIYPDKNLTKESNERNETKRIQVHTI